jgi:hypothetical protein
MHGMEPTGHDMRDGTFRAWPILRLSHDKRRRYA